MKTKIKKIYFTDDFSQENVDKLQGDGWILRNSSAVTIDDFIEEADLYGGLVPDWYPQENVDKPKKAPNSKLNQAGE